MIEDWKASRFDRLKQIVAGVNLGDLKPENMNLLKLSVESTY